MHRCEPASSVGDVAKLREELHRLQAELTAKEQEMMEMRSTREILFK